MALNRRAPGEAGGKTTPPVGLVGVLVIAGGVLVVAQLHRVGGGVIAVDLAERFAFGGAEIGLIMGAMFFASALVQLPVGLAFDRLGARRTMAWTTLVAMLGTVVFALGQTLPGLVLGRFLIGCGFSGVIMGILLLVMRWAPPERLATISARTVGLASGFGSLLATVPLALALERAGWTSTFLLLAAAAGVIGVLVFALLRDAPSGSVSGGGGETLREGVLGFARLLRRRELRPCLAMGGAAIAPFMSVAGLWAGPYLRDVHGLSSSGLASSLLGMVVVFNLSTFAYGPLDRRFATRKGVVLGGAAVTAGALLTLALVPALPLVPALVLFHLVALGAPFYVTLAAHCRAFVPDHQTGRALALLNFVALVGAFATQWLTGVIVSALAHHGGLGSAAGYRAAFGCVALLLAATAAAYAQGEDRPPARGG